MIFSVLYLYIALFPKKNTISHRCLWSVIAVSPVYYISITLAYTITFFISATLAVNYLTLSSKSEIMECGVIVIWTSTYPHFWLVDIYLVITVLNFIFLLDKKIVPKTANDIKLISAGKILENNKTVGQCKVPFGELPNGTITMHVVVQPPLTKAKTGNFHVLCANIEQEPFHISIMSCDMRYSKFTVTFSYVFAGSYNFCLFTFTEKKLDEPQKKFFCSCSIL